MKCKLTFKDLKYLMEVAWQYDEEICYAANDIITPFVNCNDTFFWGCSDAEDIESREDIDLLKKSFEDVGGHYCGSDLFCARKRKCRPQGACYTYYPEEYWHLFDECGEERETGLGNPYKPGEYKSHRERVAEKKNRSFFKKVLDKVLFRC